MKKDLQKKLRAYSSLAGAAALIAPMSASGTIVYNDVDPDVTMLTGENFEIDMDGDGTIDMVVGITSGGGTTASGATFYQNIAFADGNGAGSFAGYTASFGAIFYFPEAYAAGNNIDPGAAWQPAAAFGSMNYLTSVGGVPAYFGGAFQNQNDKYLAVRFQVAGATHYGWVRLDVGEAGSSNSVVLKDWAFEAVPEEGIEAGATTGGVDPTTGISAVTLDEQFSVYGYASTISVQSTSAEAQNATVEVYNMAGQLVLSNSLNGNSAQYSMTDADGLFVVRIRVGEAVLTRKVYLSGN